MSFVEFWRCGECRDYLTDCFCVSWYSFVNSFPFSRFGTSDRFLCEFCMNHCVQCQQSVCSVCYKEDLCCLQRPWGAKEERHLKDLYQGKVIKGNQTGVVIDQMHYGTARCNMIRKEGLERAVSFFVENGDFGFFEAADDGVGKYFPKISLTSDNMTFLEKVASRKPICIALVIERFEDFERVVVCYGHFY